MIDRDAAAGPDRSTGIALRRSGAGAVDQLLPGDDFGWDSAGSALCVRRTRSGRQLTVSINCIEVK